MLGCQLANYERVQDCYGNPDDKQRIRMPFNRRIIICDDAFARTIRCGMERSERKIFFLPISYASCNSQSTDFGHAIEQRHADDSLGASSHQVKDSHVH